MISTNKTSFHIKQWSRVGEYIPWSYSGIQAAALKWSSHRRLFRKHTQWFIGKWLPGWTITVFLSQSGPTITEAFSISGENALAQARHASFSRSTQHLLQKNLNYWFIIYLNLTLMHARYQLKCGCYLSHCILTAFKAERNELSSWVQELCEISFEKVLCRIQWTFIVLGGWMRLRVWFMIQGHSLYIYAWDGVRSENVLLSLYSLVTLSILFISFVTAGSVSWTALKVAFIHTERFRAICSVLGVRHMY